MPFINKEKQQLTRVHIEDPQNYAVTVDPIVGEMVDSLDGNSRTYIEEKMAARFATRIERREDKVTGTEGEFLARSNAAKEAAIEYGLLEVCGLFTFNRIVREWASLWTEGVTYKYDPDNDAFDEELQAARQVGGRNLVMGRVDELASAVGSSSVLVQVLGSELNYQAITRDKITVIFGETITEGDTERPVNPLNIEEATLVVVQLDSDVTSGNTQYVAYYGRSDKYPQGRQAKYWAKSWDQIPEVDAGGEDVIDYMANETDVANPMTLWQIQQGKQAVTPEYPIATWLGSTSGYGSELMPVTDGLYMQCKEFDLGASRILLSALKSARGVFAFNQGETAGNSIPESISEGDAVIPPDTNITTHYIPAVNSKDAMEVLVNLAAQTSEAFQVPAYRMGLTANITIPSGAALRELNRPLIRLRNSRTEINRTEVARMFDIERILASMENSSATGEGITEIWEPDELQFSVSELERIQAAREKVEAGFADVNQVVEEVFPHLDTQEKVDNWVGEIEARKPEPPAPAPQPVARGAAGLRQRRAAAQGQV